MAQLADKYVKLPQLGTFKTESDKVYVAKEEGKGLYPDTDKEKLAGVEAQANVNKLEGVKINGVELVIGEDKKVDITPEKLATDLEEYVKDTELTEQLGEYTKTESLADDPGIAGKYLDKETAKSTYANKNDIPKVQIPTCTQEELEEKKATAVDGDRVVVTDEEYHIYIYIGETGTGEWKDTGTHINLSDYVQKDGDKVLVSPTDVTQITTNKTNIASLQTTVSGLDETYVKTADMQVATDEDIKGIFSPAE